MRGGVALFLALAGALGASAPGSARAQATGASDTAPEVRRTVDALARCLINRQGWKVRKALDLPVSSKEGVMAFLSMFGDTCSDILEDGTAVRMPMLVVRAAMFEALYAAHYRDKPPIQSFADAPPVAYPPSTGPESETASAGLQTDTAPKYVLAMQIGECVVRAAPLEARTLVLSKVTSAEEAAAIQAVLPAISRCYPVGQQLTLSRPMLRGMMAEPLFRLTAQREAAE